MRASTGLRATTGLSLYLPRVRHYGSVPLFAQFAQFALFASLFFALAIGYWLLDARHYRSVSNPQPAANVQKSTPQKLSSKNGRFRVSLPLE